MKGRKRAFAVLAAVLSLALCRDARADGDPWWGRDKALHFSASFALASGGYGTSALFTDERGWRLAIGGTAALAAGIGKEMYDWHHGGDASWRDLTWDGVGTATGLVTAWLFDHWVRGRWPSERSLSGH